MATPLRKLPHDESAEDFSIRDKVLVLRYTRLGRLPPALYASQILREKGFPVLTVEYGSTEEKVIQVRAHPPRLRLIAKWIAWTPKKLHCPFYFIDTFIQLSREIRRGKPVLLITHGLHEQCLALLFHLLFKIRYVVHAHEVFMWKELRFMNRIYYLFERFAHRNAGFVIVPEANRAAYLKRKYRLNHMPLVVFNCPRLQAPAPRRDLRRENGLPERSLIMGYLGGIGEINCLQQAIEAIAGIPEVYFFIWGWGEKAYLDHLKKVAERVGVQSRVVFGSQLGDEKWSMLSSCDFTLCLYRPDTLRLTFQGTASNKLFESLSAGTPVITSSHFTFKDLVSRYEVGYCVDSLDSISLARVLKDIVVNPESLKVKSKNALRCYREVFYYEAQIDKAISWFEQVLEIGQEKNQRSAFRTSF